MRSRNILIFVAKTVGYAEVDSDVSEEAKALTVFPLAETYFQRAPEFLDAAKARAVRAQ
jgi:hypothetical protein